ncbi:hypothetical protein [Salinarimonas sp.]|uniref:hypothetical protein n=1 Tax=Salinarimonas sp. TaxID=2766526 RepID=UPI0032D94716
MNAPFPLCAVTGPSDALARAMAAGPRPLVPATATCAACGAMRQIAAPVAIPCRACGSRSIRAAA